MAYIVSSDRLTFLTDAAQALYADSPSTSSFLLASHNQLLNEQGETLTASQEREICLGCGTLRTPGWMSAISTQRKRKRNTSVGSHKQGSGNVSPRSGVVYKCLRCDRHVTQSLQKPPRRHVQSKKTPSSSTQEVSAPVSTTASAALQQRGKPTDTADAKKPSDNASSKKRAKARKNQGLLATLAASKQPRSQTPSASLDLLDFLQS